MEEAVLLGVFAGAIIGALIAWEAPDLGIKLLGTFFVLGVAAYEMGITHLEYHHGPGPGYEAINIGIILWAVFKTTYGFVFWFAGLVSYYATGSAVERIQKGQ